MSFSLYFFLISMFVCFFVRIVRIFMVVEQTQITQTFLLFSFFLPILLLRFLSSFPPSSLTPSIDPFLPSFISPLTLTSIVLSFRPSSSSLSPFFPSLRSPFLPRVYRLVGLGTASLRKRLNVIKTDAIKPARMCIIPHGKLILAPECNKTRTSRLTRRPGH